MKSNFWKGKKVLLTGHTGFKGSWLTLWLHTLGAKVTGYALHTPTSPSLFEEIGIIEHLESNNYCDICDLESISRVIRKNEPEIVIHMAAQSLVRESYTRPVDTFRTNMIGTVNILEAIRQNASVKVVLNITTDKCYENRELIWGYREYEPLGGHDPYSSSKACSELITKAYNKSFLKHCGVRVASARAGNVIGGGDWAKDRLIPDAIRAFESSEKLLVRNPISIRPWQHVLEPLAGYLALCEGMYKNEDDYTGPWNFGPNEDDAQTVGYLSDVMAESWGNGAEWQKDIGTHPHEAQYLKLDCSKAKFKLKWKPIWSLDRALRETVGWYKARFRGNDMLDFTLNQIMNYQKELKSNE